MTLIYVILLRGRNANLRKWDNVMKRNDVHKILIIGSGPIVIGQACELWQTMNGWVYDGFDVTYKALGVDFDKVY